MYHIVIDNKITCTSCIHQFRKRSNNAIAQELNHKYRYRYVNPVLVHLTQLMHLSCSHQDWLTMNSSCLQFNDGLNQTQTTRVNLIHVCTVPPQFLKIHLWIPTNIELAKMDNSTFQEWSSKNDFKDDLFFLHLAWKMFGVRDYTFFLYKGNVNCTETCMQIRNKYFVSIINLLHKAHNVVKQKQKSTTQVQVVTHVHV